MNPSFRKPLRILVRTLVGLMVFLLLGILCLWGLRTRVLTHFAQDYLQEVGIQDPQFTITTLQTDSLTIESIKFVHDGSEFDIKRLELSYSLSELLRSYRIEEAIISGAHLTQELAASSQDSSSEGVALPSLSDFAKQLDLSPFLPLPFKRIQISNSSVTLKRDAHATSIEFEATATASSPDAVALQAKFTQAENALQLETILSTPAASSLTASLHLANPTALLEHYLPSWRNDWPDLEELRTGQADLQIIVDTQDPDFPSLDLLLHVYELEFNYDEISGTIPVLSAKSTLSDKATIPIELAFTPQRLIRDTLAVEPDIPIELDTVITDFHVIEIQTRDPIQWVYDTDTIQATSSIELRYDLDDAESPLDAHVSNSQFTLSGTELSPFTLTTTGNTDQLSFQTSTLQQASGSPAKIQNGSGSVTLPESESEPITLSFSGTLNPSALNLNGAEASLPSAALQLETLVFETRTETQLKLTSIPAETLAILPEVATLRGAVSLSLAIFQESDSDLISGDATFDASNISIQSSSISGDGIAVQSKTEFQNLDTARLTELDPSDEQSLTELLQHTTSTLDWQANQITGPDFSAQWSGGSLALQPDIEELLITSAFGAGIFQAGPLRLEQVYLENQHRGSLAHLVGHSQISALLEGTNLQLKSDQTIENPLSELSVSGEYSSAPIVFTHSDLPGRLAPELAGLTVSAAIQAHGNFHSNATEADSTLSLTLNDGSFSYPSSQLQAEELTIELEIASLRNLDSGDSVSSLSIRNIEAGDLKPIEVESQFRILDGTLIAVDSAKVSLLGGHALLHATEIPLDGSDFQGTLDLETFDLEKIASYIDVFDGQMQGKVSGYLPFRFRDGNFELLRGDLRLPDGSPASILYETKGLLTKEKTAEELAAFSNRLLEFLGIDPELAAEQALGNITITSLETELFPEDAPGTPVRIHLAGIAHSGLGDIPVVIKTEIHGSLSQLYNFLIRLNSL